MRKTWIMIAVVLIMNSHSVWSEQIIGESDYLDNVNKLYKFAWGLQYSEEGPYDIWLIRNEEGSQRAVSNIPHVTLGYQIRDFDQDGHIELLVAELKEENKQ